MICLICRKAEAVDGLTSISFELGEMSLVVNGVPARVCPGCGEAYVHEVVAVRLLREAKKISEAGIREAVVEFNHIL